MSLEQEWFSLTRAHSNKMLIHTVHQTRHQRENQETTRPYSARESQEKCQARNLFGQ